MSKKKETNQLQPAKEELQLFKDWITAGLLPEMLPSLQPRSIKTAWLLLQAGKKLLHHHSFNALSIEDVCAEAEATVGGFYGRFSSKQAFFQTMQRLVILQSEQAMQFIHLQKSPTESSLHDACFDIVNNTVIRFRLNQGVIRASLQHAEAGFWEPFKELGKQYRAAITSHLAPFLPHLPKEQLSLRIRFAHQSMIGILAHVILHNPGVVTLDDETIIHQLTIMLCAYLTTESYT